MDNDLQGQLILPYLTNLFFVQAVFTDQPQVAYIQQDGTTQQVTYHFTHVSVAMRLLVFLKINII